MLECKLTAASTASEVGPEITAMVGLAGQLCGLLSIGCQAKAATLMASKMLGLRLDEVKNEVLDAFGEVSNMVAGDFKNKVPGIRGGCMLSAPTVVTGSDYRLHSNAAVPPFHVHLLFENMPVVISLEISA